MQRSLAAFVILVTAAMASASDHPNMIFVMADDLGYGDLGCFGQRDIQTPNIDQLAAEGTRFTDFYSGCTVCAPARSCLMTGQHTGHTWVRGNFGKSGQRVPLRDEDITVAEVLKQAGYATGIVGKWGLGEPGTSGIPNRQGFDFWFGYLNQRNAHHYYPPYLWRNESKIPLVGNLDGQHTQYSHDLMTGEALAFIDRNKNNPFFLYVAYTIPHAMLEVPSDAPYGDTNWPEPKKKFAAMVTRMDNHVGMMMKLLKDLGIDKKTLVFFCSDNGAHAEGGQKTDFFNSSGPLRGMKRDMYDGGIRVPMIARWPGRIAAGATSDQVWAMWDFLPTAAELAGAKPPAGIDGISMVNALLGKPQRDHDHLYWEFHGGGFKQALRMGRWKVVRLGPDKPIELYDLETDIGEKTNVADRHPEIVAKAERLLVEARTESPEWPLK